MSFLSLIFPVCYAIFLWWFSTGLIIAVYGQSNRIVKISFVLATLIMLASLLGLIASRDAAHIAGVYAAFTCGVLIWGWQTASYYLGFITGPVKSQSWQMNQVQTVGERFRLALKASLYHELIILGFALFIAGLTWFHTNRWGLWAFLALWIMHSSAKLNVFFGVRNFRIEFLPPHLHHLDALLTKRPSNALFLVFITLAPSIALVFIYKAIIPGVAPTQATGFLLVATMLWLGILEHLLLVLPLPATLWGWGLRALPETQEEGNTPSLQQKRLSIGSISKQVVKG